MKKLVITTLIALNIQGCALFTKPLDKPVIEEKLNRNWMGKAAVGTLSLTPERRVVLVNFTNNRFCAEAPTETGIDLASAISTNISGSQADKAKIEAEFESALNSKNYVLNKRTQGMQLFLANSYFTCRMYMNGGIDAAQLLEMQFQTLRIVEPLISAEIKLMHQKDGKNNGTHQTSSTNTSPDPIKSDAIKEEATDRSKKVLEKKNKKQDEAPKPEPTE